MLTRSVKTIIFLALAGLLTGGVVAQEDPAPPKPPKPTAKPGPAPVAPWIVGLPSPALEFDSVAPVVLEHLEWAFEDFELAPLPEIDWPEFERFGLELEFLAPEMEDLSYRLEGLGEGLALAWTQEGSAGLGYSRSLQADAAQRAQEQAKRAQERAQRAVERARRQLEREGELYQSGMENLRRSRWERGIERFTRVAAMNGRKAEGALFWKAYSELRLGAREDAQATLTTLISSYPQSRYLKDAKALEVEIQQSSGEAVSPEDQVDEELKVLAMTHLVRRDPERAIPMLEKMLQPGRSVKLRERALFLLASCKSPQALPTLTRYARGETNPDLQLVALNYLGRFQSAENLALFDEIYASSNDVDVKRRILRNYMRAKARQQVLAAARSEQDDDLRGYAVRMLGSLKAGSELAQLYQVETSPEVKKRIVHALASARAHDKLLEIMRSEQNVELRKEAIDRYGHTGKDLSSEPLLELYRNDTNAEVRKQVIHALQIKGDAAALVQLARQESNPQLKRELVKNLSKMKSKVATDYMLEILNE